MKNKRYFAFGYDEGIEMNAVHDMSGQPSDVCAIFIYGSSDERDYDVMCNPYGEDWLILYKVGENQGRKLIMGIMDSMSRHGFDVGDYSQLNLYDLVYRWKKAYEGFTYGRVEERDLKKDGFELPNWWGMPSESLVGRFVSFAYRYERPYRRIVGQVNGDGTVNRHRVFDMTRKRACLYDKSIDVALANLNDGEGQHGYL